VIEEGENILATPETPQATDGAKTEWIYDPEEGDRIVLRLQATYRRQESDFESEICAMFDKGGISYDRQKRVGTGIIDILIYGQPPTIVELKRDDSVFSLMQAITQLKFYATHFRQKPRLFVGLMPGRPISEEYREVMRQLGVGELRIHYDENTWQIATVEWC
jgi:hypothetical protein